MILLFPAMSFSQQECVVEKHSYVAISQKVIEKVIDYLYVDDRAALMKLIVNGEALFLMENAYVYVVDHHVFKGITKVRPVGSTVEVWVLEGSLDCR